MDIKADDVLVFDCEYISLAAAMARMETGVELDIAWAYKVMKKYNIQITCNDE
jgi:hypothetical protein